MPMELTERFVQERQYIINVSPKTVAWYREAFRQFATVGLNAVNEQPAATLVANIKTRIMELIGSGKVKPISINCWLRVVNAYLRWAANEGHLSGALDSDGRLLKRVKIPKLKEPKIVIEPLSKDDIAKLVKCSPKYKAEKRVHTTSVR
ncbi:MAG TPA: hypothetical protein VFQ79_18335 [Bryobacteraceae bacterium]|nr:hypothetical protein [Bryobacteraceae bacterium]